MSGNPFLVPPSAVRSAVEPAPARAGERPKRAVQPAPRDSRPARPSPNRAVGSDVLSQQAFLRDALARSSPPAVVPAGQSGAPCRPGQDCPDLALRDSVVDVGRGLDGEPVWVLRDGRRMQRNPRVGKGEPVLVPVPGGVATTR